MKLLKYKEIIGKSKEKIDELMAPIRANRMKKAAESEALKVEEDILNLQSKVQDICLEYPINFNKLLDILDEIAVLERRQEQYAIVIKDLFEDDEKE